MRIVTESQPCAQPQKTFRQPSCHRCEKPARRKGRISSSVQLESGRTVRRYLCAVCIAELQCSPRARVVSFNFAQSEERQAA